MPPQPLTRIRKICLAFPESHEVEAWGAPTFRVRNKLFAMYASPSNHHGGHRPGIWCKTPPGNQPVMVSAAPNRFFVPPYVGTSGWVGVWLDQDPDWAEVAAILEDAWRMTAPKRVLAAADAPASPGKQVKSAGRAKTAKRTAKPAKKPAAKRKAR